MEQVCKESRWSLDNSVLVQNHLQTSLCACPCTIKISIGIRLWVKVQKNYYHVAVQYEYCRVAVRCVHVCIPTILTCS